jgi:hypothetical protein
MARAAWLKVMCHTRDSVISTLLNISWTSDGSQALTQDKGGGVKPVPGAVLSGQQPGDDGALLVILVHHEASQLSVVYASIMVHQ